MIKSDKEIEAEWDARALRDAEIIKADANRFKKAQDAAKRMVEEEKKEAVAMQKVAGKRGRMQSDNQFTDRHPQQQKYGPGVTTII